MKFFRRKRVQPWMIAAGVAVIFFGFTGYAQLTGHWSSAIPNSVYERLVPQASELEHPR